MSEKKKAEIDSYVFSVAQYEFRLIIRLVHDV